MNFICISRDENGLTSPSGPRLAIVYHLLLLPIAQL